MFKIGDTVVYPAHGVGVIAGIENKQIGENVLSFYVLRIAESDYTIMIPTDNANRVGLRHPSDRKIIRRVWKILKDTETAVDNQTWNRRQREYTDKIKTGSVEDLAGVLRDLYLLKQGKELSYGERKMLEQARGLLVGELAAASSDTTEKVVAKIEAIYT